MVELDLDINGVDDINGIDGVDGLEIKLGWGKRVMLIFLVTVLTEFNCSASDVYIV